MVAETELNKLRRWMRREGVDLYIVPTADGHASEYVGEHFRFGEYLSGFTGSAGTLGVSAGEASLWTDGRYFIQAQRELSGSGVKLRKAGIRGEVPLEEWIEKTLPEGGVLGFDGCMVNSLDAEKYKKAAAVRGGSIDCSTDPAGEIWAARPSLPAEKIWILEDKYCGESALSKLARVREEMRRAGADVHLIGSLTDIAWILNLRGGDIEHVPVFYSYLLIGVNFTVLFVREEILSRKTRGYLDTLGVSIRPYEEICNIFGESGDDTGCAACGRQGVSSVLLDEGRIGSLLRQCIPEGARIINGPAASSLMKAVKNQTEISLTRLAHIKDGTALCKFLYRIKTGKWEDGFTEYEAARCLDGLRSEQENFLDTSFETICAYGANGAVVHYAPKINSAAALRAKGLFLTDSGAHYLEGSTDVSRTIVMGKISEREKRHFTAVCRGNLRLAHAKFPEGTRGAELDAIARGPIWETGTDYGHGTGHGVGHILSIHEGPNSIGRRRAYPGSDADILRPGMITTDEPGIYIEDEYGIRTENELLCVRIGEERGEMEAAEERTAEERRAAERADEGTEERRAAERADEGTEERRAAERADEGTEERRAAERADEQVGVCRDEQIGKSAGIPDGSFLEFEILTLAPIDLDGIEPSLMSEEEKGWLNDYHREVYRLISPRLEEDERAWLKEATREI